MFELLCVLLMYRCVYFYVSKHTFLLLLIFSIYNRGLMQFWLLFVILTDLPRLCCDTMGVYDENDGFARGLSLKMQRFSVV